MTISVEERNKIISFLICADLLSIAGRHIDNFEVKTTTENNSLDITANFDHKPFHFFCEDIFQSVISNDGRVLTILDGFINGVHIENIAIRFFYYHQGNFIKEPIC